MKKVLKVMGIVAIIGMIVVLLTNIEPLTIYSKTETETQVYYTYEQLDEYGRWVACNVGNCGSNGTYTEQQAVFTKDNMDTLREIKHTDVRNYTIRYQLKGFQIIKKDSKIVY